jgi:hypothetical protein
MAEVWADYDYPARKRVPVQCAQCGEPTLLRHLCGLERLVKEYRPSMHPDVLHAWARDVVATVTN